MYAPSATKPIYTNNNNNLDVHHWGTMLCDLQKSNKKQDGTIVPEGTEALAASIDRLKGL